jgi:hypothetical protein
MQGGGLFWVGEGLCLVCFAAINAIEGRLRGFWNEDFPRRGSRFQRAWYSPAGSQAPYRAQTELPGSSKSLG